MEIDKYIPSGLKIGESKRFDTYGQAQEFIKDAKSVEYFYIDKKITPDGERWSVQRYDAGLEDRQNNQDRYL